MHGGRVFERITGVGPVFAAWEAAVLPMNHIRGCEVTGFKPRDLKAYEAGELPNCSTPHGRNNRIRTCGLPLPKRARYQTAPCPDGTVHHDVRRCRPVESPGSPDSPTRKEVAERVMPSLMRRFSQPRMTRAGRSDDRRGVEDGRRAVEWSRVESNHRVTVWPLRLAITRVSERSFSAVDGHVRRARTDSRQRSHAAGCPAAISSG